jgi:hypothetical protein
MILSNERRPFIIIFAKGACFVAFNEMRTTEAMRKTADEYDLKLIEDYRDEVCKLEAEIRDLKAKLSRLQNPDAEQYLPEEMDAICSKAEEDNKQETLKKLKNAYKGLCFLLVISMESIIIEFLLGGTISVMFAERQIFQGFSQQEMSQIHTLNRQ